MSSAADGTRTEIEVLPPRTWTDAALTVIEQEEAYAVGLIFGGPSALGATIGALAAGLSKGGLLWALKGAGVGMVAGLTGVVLVGLPVVFIGSFVAAVQKEMNRE